MYSQTTISLTPSTVIAASSDAVFGHSLSFTSPTGAATITAPDRATLCRIAQFIEEFLAKEGGK